MYIYKQYQYECDSYKCKLIWYIALLTQTPEVLLLMMEYFQVVNNSW